MPPVVIVYVVVPVVPCVTGVAVYVYPPGELLQLKVNPTVDVSQ